MDDNYYMTFSVKFPHDIAVKLFEKKYGSKPERVFIDKGLLKVGPEPKRSFVDGRS